MFERLKAIYNVKEYPMVKNVFAWLVDPAAPGRKRGIAAALFILAGLLRAAEPVVADACEQALLTGSACSLHLATAASWFDVAYQAVQTYAVPSMDVVGAIVGVWGLIHAHMRNHVVVVGPAGSNPVPAA